VRPFNADGDFVSGMATDGGAVRRMTVRGAGATMFAGGLALVIQLCSTMVLARILNAPGLWSGGDGHYV